MACLTGCSITADCWEYCLYPSYTLTKTGGHWRIDREFNAIELTIGKRETVQIDFEEGGFFWVETQDGDAGWVPCENISTNHQAYTASADILGLL